MDVSLQLQIGHLTLNGYTPAQQRIFMRALQRSIERLSADGRPGTASLAKSVEHLPAIQAPPGSTVEDAAHMLARQLLDLTATPRGSSGA